jgi:hypothetical protein
VAVLDTDRRQTLLYLLHKEGGAVTFGINDKGQIKGKGIIGKNDSARIEDVQYVEGLKHNLLSISQLCDSGFEVIFKPNICEVKQVSTGNIFFTGSRKKDLYILFLDDIPTESCFMFIDKDKWIWHKRVGHVSIKTISKISQLDLVRGLPKINFDKDKICEACVRGKQDGRRGRRGSKIQNFTGRGRRGRKRMSNGKFRQRRGNSIQQTFFK